MGVGGCTYRIAPHKPNSTPTYRIAPCVFLPPPSPPALSLHSLESPGESSFVNTQAPGSCFWWGGTPRVWRRKLYNAIQLVGFAFPFDCDLPAAGTHITLTTKNVALETQGCTLWAYPCGLTKIPQVSHISPAGFQYEGLASLSVFYTRSRLLLLLQEYSSYRAKYICSNIETIPSTEMRGTQAS